MVRRYGIGTMSAMAATIVLWSTTFAGLVAALDHFAWGHLLFLRWTLTAMLFIAFGVATGMRLPRRADLPRIVLAGFLGFGLYQILLVTGQTGVSATMAGFLINMSPVFTTVLAVALGRERSRRATWVGLAVCTVGMVVMGTARGGFGETGPSALLVVGAALSFSLYSLVSRPLLARYSPIEVTAYAVVAGSLPFVMFAPGAFTALAGAGPEGLAVLAYLAVVPGGIAYVLWTRSLVGLGPGLAVRFLYLIPVLGMFVSWAWVGETPHALTVAGGLVVTAGVALASGAVRLPGARVALPRPASATAAAAVTTTVPAEAA